MTREDFMKMELHEIERWVFKRFHHTIDFWPEDVWKSVAFKAKKIWKNLQFRECEICEERKNTIVQCSACGSYVCELCGSTCPNSGVFFCENCPF